MQHVGLTGGVRRVPYYLVVTLQRVPCMSCGWRLNRPRVTVTAVFVVNHDYNNSFQFPINPRYLELGEVTGNACDATPAGMVTSIN